MITDSTYYQQGEYYIPNIKDVSVAPVDAPSSQSELEYFIDKYERELLLELGVSLFTGLETAMLDLPNADQKWQDLVNGKTYTINSKEYRWEGLKGYNKNSLLAAYVYCQYKRNDESTYTTTGDVKINAANANEFTPTDKYIKAYNAFIKMYQGDLCASGPTVLVNGFGNIGLDYYGSNKVQVSLWQYLNHANELEPTDFPDFEFKFYNVITSLGI